jgi:PAS domain-containing protein
MERAALAAALPSAAPKPDADALAGALLEAAPVAMGVLSPDMRLQRLNPALARLLDVAEERTQEDEALADVAPELAPYLQVHAQHVLATGRALSGVPLAFEQPRGSGRMREVQASYFPLLAEDGQRVQAVGFVLAERGGDASMRAPVQASASASVH